MSLTETGQTFRPVTGLPPLIPVQAVRALIPDDYDKIFRRVDGGDMLEKPLVWVWNFATNPAGDMRDLRFWRYELEQPGTTGHLEIEWVIERILPPRRDTYEAGNVVEMFTLTRSSLKNLRPQMAGQLITGGSTYTRAGLAAFLTARWLGSVYNRKAKTL